MHKSSAKVTRGKIEFRPLKRMNGLCKKLNMVLTEEILAIIIAPYGTAFKGKHVHNMRMYTFQICFST